MPERPSQLIVESFRYGLDTRRSELTSLPGTLYNLIDAHITPGGRIQKRKAFVKVANESEDDSLPPDTFGLQATRDAILVFTSESLTGKTFPSPVQGVRLQHPAVLAGKTPTSDHDLVAVVHSTLYRGAAFVLAKFSDGHIYPYYNGELVTDFTDGLVMAYMTSNTDISEAIEEMVNRSGVYVAVHPASGVENRIEITGAYGIPYTIVVTKETTAGTITVTELSAQTEPVAGHANRWSFRIMGGSAGAGNTVSSIKINGVELISGAVAWSTSNAQTATNIAMAINTHTSDPDYSATAIGDLVQITAVDESDEANSYGLSVTATGDVLVGLFAAEFDGTVTSCNNITAGGTDIFLGSALSKGSMTTSEFVAAIAARIRDGTGTPGSGDGTAAHGYTASNVTSTLYISKATTTDTDSDVSIAIDYTDDGTNDGVTAGSPPPPTTTLTAVLSKTTLFYVKKVTSGSGRTTYVGTGPVQVIVTGGTSPYTYFWQRYDSTTETWENASPASGKISALSITGQSTYFGCADVVIDEEVVSDRLRCLVTDSTSGTPLTTYSNEVRVSLGATTSS